MMGQVSSSMVKRSQNDFLNISLAGFQKHLKNGCAFFFQRGYVQVQKKLTLHSEKSTWNLKITPSGEENHLQNLHFWFQNPNFRGYNTLFEVPFQIKSLDLQIWKLWKNEAVLNQKWKRYRKWNLKSKMEVLLLVFWK